MKNDWIKILGRRFRKEHLICYTAKTIPTSNASTVYRTILSFSADLNNEQVTLYHNGPESQEETLKELDKIYKI